MQQFVLAPDIGGFRLTEKAAHYLDWMDKRKKYEEGSISVDPDFIGGIDSLDQFEKDIYQVDDSGVWFWSGAISECCVATSFLKNKAFDRNDLLPLMQNLGYDYGQLDIYNDGTHIRIKSVPDDANVYITEDFENGYEYLAERTRMYTCPDDREDRVKFLLEDFFNSKWDGTFGLFREECMDIYVAEKYGMARYGDFYAVLTRNTYHDKTVYEPVYLGHEAKSVNVNPVDHFLIPADQMRILEGMIQVFGAIQ